jgi:hypothetical protein
MSRFRYINAVVVQLAVVISLFGVFTVPADAQGTTASVSLRPGIVFDPNRKVAYVMTPEGVAAVDLATGTKVWTSTAADQPLTLAGNLLITQVEPRVAGNVLELLVLDPRERGAAKVRKSVQLPSGVSATIGENLIGKFLIEAQPVANEIILNWAFEPREQLRGRDERYERKNVSALEKSTQRQSSIQETTASPQVTTAGAARGTVRMTLPSGSVTLMAVPLTTMKTGRQWILPTAMKLSNAPPTQYESADGRHILASERVADDRVWEKYRWTVFDRAGNRLGEHRTHISFAPFVVNDSTIFYETTPYVRGDIAEPARLRAISLSTGRELWNAEVRELVYRGPYPP